MHLRGTALMFQMLDTNENENRGKPANFQYFVEMVLLSSGLLGEDCGETTTTQQLPMHVRRVWSLSASGVVNIAKLSLLCGNHSTSDCPLKTH